MRRTHPTPWHWLRDDAAFRRRHARGQIQPPCMANDLMLLGAGASGSGVVANGLLTGLLAYWTLNESSGNRADSVGAATMTNVNSCGTAAGFGSVGAVTTFTGTNYLTFGGLIVNSGSWTMAGWFNATSFAANRTIFCQGKSSASSLQLLRTNTSGNLAVIVDGSNTDTGATVLSAATWYFVALTYSATAVNAYLNGSGTPEVTATRTASYTGGNVTRIGVSGLTGQQMLGSEVAWGVWSRVLSAADMTFLYNSGNGRAFSEFN